MRHRIDAKAIFTVAVLLGVFAVALLRSNHWQLSRVWTGWAAITDKRSAANPEDEIYAMFDATRAGDAKAYLNCFSGPLREQLAATEREDSGTKFKAYLRSQNSAVQGMAVTVTDGPTADEARARVEYVYTDHNDVQNLRLRREGRRWKIISIDGAEPARPPVPYGSKATD